MVIYKLSEDASGETNSANSLILDFQPPEVWESKFLQFVAAALAN